MQLALLSLIPLLTTLPLVLSLSNPFTTSLGINCRGSLRCDLPNCYGRTCLEQILLKLNKLPDENHYANGKHIACIKEDPEKSKTGGMCAFFQNTARGGTGALAKQMVQDLIDYGCRECGSSPTQPGNNIKTGELTVNWVSRVRIASD